MGVDHQCSAITRNGTKCKNRGYDMKEGKVFCSFHCDIFHRLFQSYKEGSREERRRKAIIALTGE